MQKKPCGVSTAGEGHRLDSEFSQKPKQSGQPSGQSALALTLTYCLVVCIPSKAPGASGDK